MNIALVGNPNSGKSTLFSALTKTHQTIGNFPGVTIEKKEGRIEETHHYIIDLPGTYSLFPYSKEEEITVDYLNNEKIDVIFNVIDGTCLERSLFLTTQLLSLKKRVIVVITMEDCFKEEKISFNKKKLEELLGVEVIVISRKNTKSLDDLINKIEKETATKEPKFVFFPSKDEKEIEKQYQMIEQITKEVYQREENVKTGSSRLDDFFLHPFWSIPIFILIMISMYAFVILVVGNGLTPLLENGLSSALEKLSSLLEQNNIQPWLNSLFVHGILGSVGSMLCFLPELIALFFFIAFLENTGYLARISFILDGLLQKVSLSGKTMIPFLVGSGCSVPGIMITRTIPSMEEREKAIVLTPFVPCSAKLPIIVLFASHIFYEKRFFFVISLYLLAILFILIYALIFKKLFQRNHTSEFFIELPKYHWPNLNYIAYDVYEKGKSFIKKTMSIVLLCSIFVWFLSSFSWNLTYGIPIEKSILSDIGRLFSWLFYPMVGENSWALTVSAFQGIIAKEQVVSSLRMIAGLDSTLGDESIFLSSVFSMFQSKSAAYAYILFILFSAPCISAIATMKKELGSTKKTMKYLILQTALAFLLSYLAFGIGSMIEGALSS